jgi:hypothetical protein
MPRVFDAGWGGASRPLKSVINGHRQVCVLGCVDRRVCCVITGVYPLEQIVHSKESPRGSTLTHPSNSLFQFR